MSEFGNHSDTESYNDNFEKFIDRMYVIYGILDSLNAIKTITIIQQYLDLSRILNIASYKKNYRAVKIIVLFGGDQLWITEYQSKCSCCECERVLMPIDSLCNYQGKDEYVDSLVFTQKLISDDILPYEHLSKHILPKIFENIYNDNIFERIQKFIDAIPVDILLNCRDKYNSTLLHRIFYSDNLNDEQTEYFFDLFLKIGIDPTVEDNFGYNIMLLSIRNGNPKILKKSLALGFDVNYHSKDEIRDEISLSFLLFRFSTSKNILHLSDIEKIIDLLNTVNYDFKFTNKRGNCPLDFMHHFKYYNLLNKLSQYYDYLPREIEYRCWEKNMYEGKIEEENQRLDRLETSTNEMSREIYRLLLILQKERFTKDSIVINLHTNLIRIILEKLKNKPQTYQRNVIKSFNSEFGHLFGYLHLAEFSKLIDDLDAKSDDEEVDDDDFLYV